MEIRIENLSKTYPGGKQALNNVSLTIGNGMFGLLGPNGAGKTTLMRILVTLMEPSGGTALFDGLDLKRNRGRIRAMLGYLPQEYRMFPRLKTWEYLDYSASLAGISRARDRRGAVDRMLESVGLFEARDRMANKLSGGMKRRLGIAQALIGDPKILVVDEPTTGLDPEERLRFRNLLADLSQGDRIVILSTHIVGDISSTCHDMAMLHRGEVVYHGAPDSLVDRARGHAWSIETDDAGLLDLKERYPVVATIPTLHGWEVQVVCASPDGYPARAIEPNLEHAYLHFLEERGLNDDIVTFREGEDSL
ncbi:MAG: ABC transporter ATP-binding protein [Candidatus Latescibacterota bacterium]